MKKIICDKEDLIARLDCGCYCREEYNFGDQPYLVSCLAHKQIQALVTHLRDYISLMDKVWPDQEDEVKSKARALLNDCTEASNV